VAALPAIRRWLPQLHTVIDPAAELLAWIESQWGLHGGEGAERFVTTGSAAATREAARLAFGLSLPAVQTVDLHRR
jgi:hypothetical protein